MKIDFNRRKFLYSSALGLFVPSLFGMPPMLRQRMVKQARIITPAAETLKVSLGAAASSTDYVGYDGVDPDNRWGQFGSWTTTSAFTLTKIEFCICREGSTGGASIYSASVYSSDGTNPTTEVVASTTTYANDTLNTAPAQYWSFTFPETSLSNATEYFFGLWSTGINTTKVVQFKYVNSGAYKMRTSRGEKASPTWMAPDNSMEASMKIYGK